MDDGLETSLSADKSDEGTASTTTSSAVQQAKASRAFAAPPRQQQPEPRRRLMSDAFMMRTYKIKFCKRTDPHNWRLCPYAHPGEAGRRRPPHTYQPIMCDFAKSKTKECSHGESCPFARNALEYYLHPDKYRTSFCGHGEACTRNICFFAHNQQELRTGGSSSRPGATAAGSSGDAADPAHVFSQLSIGEGSAGSSSSQQAARLQLPQTAPKAFDSAGFDGSSTPSRQEWPNQSAVSADIQQQQHHQQQQLWPADLPGCSSVPSQHSHAVLTCREPAGPGMSELPASQLYQLAPLAALPHVPAGLLPVNPGPMFRGTATPSGNLVAQAAYPTNPGMAALQQQQQPQQVLLMAPASGAGGPHLQHGLPASVQHLPPDALLQQQLLPGDAQAAILSVPTAAVRPAPTAYLQPGVSALAFQEFAAPVLGLGGLQLQQGAGVAGQLHLPVADAPVMQPVAPGAYAMAPLMAPQVPGPLLNPLPMPMYGSSPQQQASFLPQQPQLLPLLQAQQQAQLLQARGPSLSGVAEAGVLGAGPAGLAGAAGGTGGALPSGLLGAPAVPQLGGFDLSQLLPRTDGR